MFESSRTDIGGVHRLIRINSVYRRNDIKNHQCAMHRRDPMANRLSNLAAAAFFATSVVALADVTSAMPLDALAAKNAAPLDIEVVHWRGGGWGIAAGIIGGAIIGGMLAAPYRYGPGPYSGYGYYAPGYAYGPAPAYAYEPAPVYVAPAYRYPAPTYAADPANAYTGDPAYAYGSAYGYSPYAVLPWQERRLRGADY
jgi:hypothetical protein